MLQKYHDSQGGAGGKVIKYIVDTFTVFIRHAACSSLFNTDCCQNRDLLLFI